MRTPIPFLKIVAGVTLRASGTDGIWSILDENMPELADEIWADWSAVRTPTERRDDLEAVALMDDHAAPDVAAILTEVAPDQPGPVRQELAAFLMQLPVTVRQSLRRPDDPTGRSVPPTLEPRSGQDLISFLAAQRPRFKVGDRPIPGADWELAELLGIGGFGEVWKALHTLIDDFEPVALKFCINPEARERLLTHEARICARVQREGRHPGIVALQQTYLAADPPCLQYEYVEGGTLGGLIKDWSRRDPRPSAEEVTRHLLSIAEVVAFTHRLNPPIVHRDLKPANILVRGTNGATRFKIADFGIGWIATAGVIRATRPSFLLTRAVCGSYTPLYASPEQAAGGAPDPRDDVHALGVIWYQMLTGDLTSGRPGGAVWRRRFAERGIPPALVDLLDSCFEEAAERMADAAVLCERIAAVLAPAGHPAPEPPPAEPPGPITPEPPGPPGGSRRSTGELRRFDGHTDEILGVAFAPDGRTALSASQDKTVRLWDVATGREIRRLDGHKLWIRGVAFAPDGRTALSASHDQTVRLWDVATGREIRRLNGHTGGVVGVAFAPDGRTALSASSDHTARLWNVATGREVLRLDGHTRGVLAVAIAPDARTALSASRDQTVRLWDMATGREIRRLDGHTGGVLGVAFAPDGRTALSASHDHTLKLWDVATGREVLCLVGHTGGVSGVVFAPDGRTALSASVDQTVRLWDVATGREVRCFEGHSRPVLGVAFAPDGRTALSASADKTVRLWGLPEVS